MILYTHVEPIKIWCFCEMKIWWNVWLIFHHIFWKIHTYTARIISEWSEASPSVFLSYWILLARTYQFNKKNTFFCPKPSLDGFAFVLVRDLQSLYLNWKRLREYILKLFRQIDQVKSKQISAFMSKFRNREDRSIYILPNIVLTGRFL